MASILSRPQCVKTHKAWKLVLWSFAQWVVKLTLYWSGFKVLLLIYRAVICCFLLYLIKHTEILELLCLNVMLPMLLYPPHNEVVGGYTGFTPSVRPSVRLSVRPSVPHAVSALYHLQLWMDSFHIRHKWSLQWEGVSRTMTFDLDLYLQGHLALT